MVNDSSSSRDKFENLIRWRLRKDHWAYVTEAEARVINVSSKNDVGLTSLLKPNLPVNVSPQALKNLFKVIASDALDHIVRPKIAIDFATLIVALANNYTIVSRIEKILEVAIAGCEQKAMNKESEFLLSVLYDERGHSELIEKDLKGLGINCNKLMSGTQRSAAEALVLLLNELAQGREPFALLGVGFLLESNALSLDDDFFRQYEFLVPEIGKAKAFFNIHSALGEEREHFERLLLFLTRLEVPRLRAVISAYQQAVDILATYPNPSLLVGIDSLKA